MGEQRSRRTGKQPAIDLIDTSRSRGLSAASQAPFRKTRPERHRKSDRKREYRNGRKRSSSKQRTRTRVSSPQWSVNPRVNPIFVWARQENNHIVEVKCEDYDKRNRILLTKTAQGWRAIPRTETLVPTLKEEVDDKSRCRMRKQRKTHRIKRKSTGVQVDEDMTEAETQERSVSPMWTDPVNVESHLPSHTIHITKKRSPSPQEFAQRDEIINSATSPSILNPVIGCNINKTSDVTPLDNLLAVAELEFKQQLQSGEWNKCSETDNIPDDNDADIDMEKQKSDEYIDNIEQLNNFINSCTNNDNINDAEHIIQSFNDVQSKTEDCDYNEDDDNNLAMDDILNRLEQSLRSPEVLNAEILTECDNVNTESSDLKSDDVIYDQKETNFEDIDTFENKETEMEYDLKNTDTIVQSSSDDIDSSSDLTITKTQYESEDLQPTDLSLPKRKETKSPPLRPPSQNSETIQSPQPSGIPAVPPSPDIFSNPTDSKSKSLFLETLLSCQKPTSSLETFPSCQKPTSSLETFPSCQKPTNNVQVNQQKEPLDLGNFRKSASPTVSCSEEVKNKTCFDEEPSTKKLKVDDITLKKLLDMNPKGNINYDSNALPNNHARKEASRLLELLSTPLDSDPVAQLNQLLTDSSISIPDPMLVPKDRLSLILSSPAREIPRLLIDRPELRLPQALAYPYLLQDPDILVITLSQLETIVQKQSQFIPLKDVKTNDTKRPEITEEKRHPKPENVKRQDIKPDMLKNDRPNAKEAHPRRTGYINELVKDIDAASNAAFNQMMWLPYLNQIDFSNFNNNNNADLLKLLTFLPSYATHSPDMSLFMGVNRYMQPPSFPIQQPFSDPLEFSTWQEAVMQANLLRPNNNQYDLCNSKNFYNRYCGEKHSYQKPNHFVAKPNQKMNKMPNMFPPNIHQNNHNTMMNLPSNYYSANKTSLQVPQYNPVLPHANLNDVMKSKSMQQQTSKNSAGSRMDLYNHQLYEDKKLNHTAQAPRQDQQQNINNNYKMNNKSHSTFSHQENVNKACPETTKHSAMQPIDLSGSSTSGSKLKVRQHLIDPNHAQKLLKHDDVPEVGSTTASIEEMQDAQKFLWHPLFGNQKGYANPWNWTTVTATGE